jgi:hypothetical protein
MHGKFYLVKLFFILLLPLGLAWAGADNLTFYLELTLTEFELVQVLNPKTRSIFEKLMVNPKTS